MTKKKTCFPNVWSSVQVYTLATPYVWKTSFFFLFSDACEMVMFTTANDENSKRESMVLRISIVCDATTTQ